MPNPFWTEERQAELKRLYIDEKRSASVVGEHFGKTRNSIIGAAHRMGIAKDKPKPKQKPMQKLVYKRARTAMEKVERRKQPPSRPIVRGEDIPPLLHNILDLTSTKCAYPYGVRQFKFCGRKKTRGAFCDQHAEICYNNPLYGRAS